MPDVINYLQENPRSSWLEIALAEPRVSNMMRCVRQRSNKRLALISSMSRLAEKVRAEVMPQRDGVAPHKGIWVFGAPGVGKSHWAAETYPGAFYKEPDNKWWDEYCSEDVVILDEFVGSVKMSLLLRWVDKYKCKAESKGSMLRLANTTTVVLSNHPPWEMYPNVSEMRKSAMYRRFKVYEMKIVDGQRVRERKACPGEVIPRGGDAVPRRPQSLVRQNATVGAGGLSPAANARVLSAAAGFRRYSENGQGEYEDDFDAVNDN